jgi:hypothetical protein
LEFCCHGSNPFGFGSCLAVCGRFRGEDETGVGKERMLVGKEGGKTREGSGFRGAGLRASDRAVAWDSKMGRKGGGHGRWTRGNRGEGVRRCR